MTTASCAPARPGHHRRRSGSPRTAPHKVNNRGPDHGRLQRHQPRHARPNASERGFLLDRSKITRIDAPDGRHALWRGPGAFSPPRTMQRQVIAGPERMMPCVHRRRDTANSAGLRARSIPARRKTIEKTYNDTTVFSATFSRIRLKSNVLIFFTVLTTIIRISIVLPNAVVREHSATRLRQS